MRQKPAALLVDTHAFLWFVFDDARLSGRAARYLGDPGVTKVLSLVSLWEMAIKVSLGKLHLGQTYEEFVEKFVERRAIELLDVRVAHLKQLAQLPFRHRDPFDRLVVAQAMVERLAVLTADPRFAAYGVKVAW